MNMIYCFQFIVESLPFCKICACLSLKPTMTSKGDAAALLLKDVIIPFYEPVERMRCTSAYAVHTDSILASLESAAIGVPTRDKTQEGTSSSSTAP